MKFVVHCGAQDFGLFRVIREIRGSLRGSKAPAILGRELVEFSGKLHLDQSLKITDESGNIVRTGIKGSHRRLIKS